MKRLFVNAGILAWKDETFHYIEDGCLAVDGDTISYIGKERPAGEYDDVRDMSGKLLMPGLINCHCHNAMVLLRGIGSDLPLQQWLFDEMFPVEDRLTAEDIKAGNELAMMELIASGVTSFSDMYMEAQTLIELNERIGMKASVCRVIQSFDPNEKPEDSVRIKESCELFETYNGCQNDRIRIDFAVHAEYTSTDAVTSGYADRIRKYIPENARMQIHLSETKKEHNECIERHGMTPCAWFEKMGILDVPTAAAHCVCVTDEDMEIMKRKNVSAIHNPTSNMKLGSGFAPIPTMLERGINVALGTDGAASNNNLNMFEEMHLAAIIHNGYHNDAVIMKPETVLKMATVNGAKLQGRDDTGCLEVGKKADIIAVDFSRKPHMYPAFEPMAMLVYAAQASDVCMTMVDGNILYENGEFLTLNREEVIANAKAAVQRLYKGERK